MNGPEVNADGVVTMKATFDHEKAKREELRNVQSYVKADTKVSTKEELLCMKCSQPVGELDHLSVGTSAGPWYCEFCGTGHLIKRTEDGADVTESKDRIVKTLVLLKLAEPTKKPIHIVVEGRMFVPVGKEVSEVIDDQQSRDKYYFNEHTCPTNYLDARIAVNGDTDPHGVFKHVQTVIKPDGDNHGRIVTSSGNTFPDNYYAWMDLFPILQ